MNNIDSVYYMYSYWFFNDFSGQYSSTTTNTHNTGLQLSNYSLFYNTSYIPSINPKSYYHYILSCWIFTLNGGIRGHYSPTALANRYREWISRSQQLRSLGKLGQWQKIVQKLAQMQNSTGWRQRWSGNEVYQEAQQVSLMSILKGIVNRTEILLNSIFSYLQKILQRF